MLDTRFKELCNGLCSAGGSTKSTRKTINAVNSASKILEIYRSLPAAGAGTSPLRNIDESDGGIVGLSKLGRDDSDSNFQILCRSEQCQRACPEGGFCSRRCEGGEADRVATVAKMVLAGNDSKRTTSAPARRKTQTASLASMMENLAKPPAPRKSSSADESSSSKADEEALRAFVVEVVGEKYWPVFEREEIEDLKCGAQRPNRTSDDLLLRRWHLVCVASRRCRPRRRHSRAPTREAGTSPVYLHAGR